MEQRTFTRRDSATAFLRKHGIDKAEYANYIFSVDGNFRVNLLLDKPTPYVEVRKAVTKKVPDGHPIVGINKFKKATAVLDAQPIPTKDRMAATKDGLISNKRTISYVARLLIKQGKTNAEVWEALKKEFSLSDNKKHYPAWYRAELNRKGG